MRKKLCVLLAGVLSAGMLLAGCSNGSDLTVSVQSVGMITGYGSVGLYDRYAGIVEAGETVDIKKDDTMEVDEVLVKVGQAVKAGDVLFTYDTETISLDLEKKQLELEQLKNTITTKNAQITTLEKEKAQAASSAQLDYTLQIQALQIEVKETEYNVTAKEKEIERSKTVLENAQVTATVDGTVSSINTDNATDDWGNPKPFISITEAGDFRVKGTINEQNAYALAVDTPVIIRARVGDASWTGTITLVDFEHPTTGNDDGYYYMGASDEMTSSSKYPFYVELDTDDNLMLGQHVYIEPDLGQDEQEGFYLPAPYIVDADGDAYVWAASDEDKLEKRTVSLGAFDEGLDSYEILGGLELTDYIADPSQECEAGAAVEYYDENSFDDGVADGYIPENDEGMIDGLVDGEITDGLDSGDGIVSDGTEPVDDGMLPDAGFDQGLVSGETEPAANTPTNGMEDAG